jgi:hypothetical protein
VRDRSQILVDVTACNKDYLSADVLLQSLGHPWGSYVYPSAGIPENLVSDLLAEWSQIENLALSPEFETARRTGGRAVTAAESSPVKL